MEDERDVMASLALELRRGTLVLSVLSQLRESRYGYALVQKLESCGVPIDPSTLYPLLRRLEKRACSPCMGYQRQQAPQILSAHPVRRRRI